MNSLSWLLYLADVLPSVATWLAFVAFFLFLVTGIAFFVGITDLFGEAGTDDLKKIAAQLRNWGSLWILFFLLWGAAFLVPDKDTFYMIAASEVGEEVLQTPEVGKIRDLINKKLDEALGDDEEKVVETKETING